MERYRNFVRLEQMKENIRAGRNEEALKLADQLDPAKIRSNSDLSILSDLYLESGMLAKAGNCLSELYNRKKTRSILMQLINLSVRIKKVEEAETYYREFKAMAPDDFYNYIFRYSIDKIKGRDYGTLIESLEKLKEAEYIDSWAYELAKLYHKAGRKDDCIRECDDIAAWFGDGEYVDRAKALKAYYLGELNNVMSRPVGERKAEPEEDAEEAADGDEELTAEKTEAEEPEYSEVENEPESGESSYDSGVEEIIGTVEETAARLYSEPEESTDKENEVVPENPEESEQEFEESDYEEDLKEFEQEFNIKLADEVMAQIDGLDETHFEVEPVDISGVLDDEEFRDHSDDVKIAYGRKNGDSDTEGSKTFNEDEAIEEEYTTEELEAGEAESPAAESEQLDEGEDEEEPETFAEDEAAEVTGLSEEDEEAEEALQTVESEAEEEPEAKAGAESESETEEEVSEAEDELPDGDFEETESDEEAVFIEAVSPETVSGDSSIEEVAEEEADQAEAAEPAVEDEEDEPVTSAEDDTAEAETAGNDSEEIETVSHVFRGPGNVKIAKDSLLAAFLARNNAELEDYFGFFAYQAETRGQIIKTLEILLNPQIKNKCVVVSGERNSGSKTIIKGLTRVLNQSGFLKSPQIAFTEAEKINSMNLESNLERLMGCCLMINHAGKLSANSVRQLLEVNPRFSGKTAVIVTDTRSGISGLFKENREINSMFPLRIHIPEYDSEDMEDLLFVRLNEKSYEIEKNAYELMRKELKKIVREVGAGCLAEADRYIEAVTDRLETRNAKKLLSGGFDGVSAADRIILAGDIRP